MKFFDQRFDIAGHPGSAADGPNRSFKRSFRIREFFYFKFAARPSARFQQTWNSSASMTRIKILVWIIFFFLVNISLMLIKVWHSISRRLTFIESFFKKWHSRFSHEIFSTDSWTAARMAPFSDTLKTLWSLIKVILSRSRCLRPAVKIFNFIIEIPGSFFFCSDRLDGGN